MNVPVDRESFYLLPTLYRTHTAAEKRGDLFPGIEALPRRSAMRRDRRGAIACNWVSLLVLLKPDLLLRATN